MDRPDSVVVKSNLTTREVSRHKAVPFVLAVRPVQVPRDTALVIAIWCVTLTAWTLDMWRPGTDQREKQERLLCLVILTAP